jgi:hypothetical protein
MLRVLGTLKRSVFAKKFQSQINDLGSWVSEIHSGMYPYLVRNPPPYPICSFLLTGRTARDVQLATQRSV